jgi:hypothetical protein
MCPIRSARIDFTACARPADPKIRGRQPPMKKLVVQFIAVCLTNIAVAADTQPPVIQTASPAASAAITSLSQILVAFSEPVIGVQAGDLLVNGEPAIAVTNSANTFTFQCSTPMPGFISVFFDEDHGITDQAGNPFDESAPGATWFYTLADTTAPAVARVTPPGNAAVRSLAAVEVVFTEIVSGITAEDLLANGAAAVGVAGSGAGPYRFSFPTPAPGLVNFSWALAHDIADLAGNAFNGGNWTVQLNPAAPASVRINEFLAANESASGLRDEDNELHDWIELHNHGAQPVNLAGWSLSNDPNEPRQWVFPAVTINPGQYLVVFASGKNRFGARLHANFQLSAAGEYLALLTSDEPAVAASQFDYPEQRIDHSFGYDSSGQLRYFSGATPGAANGASSIQSIAPPVHFSVSRGFFNAPFNLVLTAPAPGAAIRYTLDGSPPTAGSPLYVLPFIISNTVAVRAVAFLSNALPSLATTHTYIFPDQVLRQPANPPGFPSTWVTQSGSVIVPADYGMDARIVNNPAYTNFARQALTTIPTLSVVMKTSDLFSQANGIYSNPRGFGLLWERPASAEFIFTDGSGAVQIDAGYRIQGGSSREENKDHKHSQRLLFRGAYGAGRFQHRIFHDSPVESFDSLVVDAGLNLVWTHRTDSTQRRQGQYVRDQFMSDLQNAMGWPAFHGRFFHLYLNGLYWGLHDIHERPEEDFAASYFGGDETQWDVIKSTTSFEVLSGDAVAWNAMRNLATAGLANDSQYQQIQQYLDVASLIDYMILNIYGGNTDWPHHNWYVARRRQPAGTFKFFSWDAEHVLKDANYNNAAVANANTPAEFYDQLRRNNAEFRLRFADQVHKHFFNGGLCTTNQARDRYLARIREIDPAIILESARWGDNASNADRPGFPYERNIEWINELNRLLNSWFPQRSTIVLNQFRTNGLYPLVAAPAFNQHGGRVTRGFNLAISAPAGAIYFTTNGVDPRVYLAGSPAPDALLYSSPVALSRTMVVKARALSGTNWSALNEATFTIEQLTSPLRITEIMYNPPGGDAYEFIELRNTGETPLDVSGFSFSGITYAFPPGSVLAPGQTIVLAANNNPAAFAARYPGLVVFGYFADRLNNGGERLAIKGRFGETILSVDYSDEAPWPLSADGSGSSIELIDFGGDVDAPANWRASTMQYGTPGSSGVMLFPVVRINEVMADNAGAVTNGGAFPDWIELQNTGDEAVDLSGWSLSDDGNPRRFVFPPGTAIGHGEYLVLWCDTQTNLSGLHTGFSLDNDGESVFLFDAMTNRMDGLSFGSQAANYTLGLIGNDWRLCSPTPGAGNVAVATASPTNLVINEWVANALPGGSDWIELFNASADRPIPLRGTYLGTSNALFQIQTHAFLPPLGHLQLLADELPGENHLDFKLPAEGGAIVLYDNAGIFLSRIIYGPQSEGLSRGRFPDGAVSIQNFPGSASPGAPNYVISYSGPFLNEVMAKNLSGARMSGDLAADWIELRNPAATNVDLSGMRLSLDEANPGQWVFPAGAVIPGHGHLIVWCTSARPASAALEAELNAGQGIDAQSGSVFLFNAQGQIVDSVEFGFQIDDQSIGRTGAEWQLLATPTPGASNSPPAQLGSPAALAINEWMASPLSGPDWFELYNRDTLPVSLSGLSLTDDPSIFGVTNSVFAPLSFIGPGGFVQVIADDDPGQGRDHVRFRLDELGETIRLYSSPAGAGQLIDAVDFGISHPGVSEGRLPDGSVDIVQFPVSPSPGRANHFPPFLAMPRLLPGEFEVFLHATVGRPHVIESSTDLSDWSELMTLTPTNSQTRITDPSPGATRFYRARVVP